MQIAVLGIDLGKNSCSVAGLDATGRVILRRRTQGRRGQARGGAARVRGGDGGHRSGEGPDRSARTTLAGCSKARGTRCF